MNTSAAFFAISSEDWLKMENILTMCKCSETSSKIFVFIMPSVSLGLAYEILFINIYIKRKLYDQKDI